MDNRKDIKGIKIVATGAGMFFGGIIGCFVFSEDSSAYFWSLSICLIGFIVMIPGTISMVWENIAEEGSLRDMRKEIKVSPLIYAGVLILTILFGYYCLEVLPENGKKIAEQQKQNAEVRNANQEARDERYGVFRNFEGGASFYYYDIEKNKRLDNWQEYLLFTASIEESEGAEKSIGFSNFVKNNKSSVFKITGTKTEDDCQRFGSAGCVENIMIESIETVGKRESKIIYCPSGTPGWYSSQAPNDYYKELHPEVACDDPTVVKTGWVDVDDELIEKYLYRDGSRLYSGEIRDLPPVKSMQEIRELLSSEYVDIDREPMLEDSFSPDEFDRRYLPDRSSNDTNYADVDGDGLKERIDLINGFYTMGADSCCDFAQITKDDKVIFTFDWAKTPIIPDKNGNGFYVRWRSFVQAVPSSTPSGHTQTHFIWQDGEFVPTRERTIMY